jgi:hypothetical protein
MQGLIDLKISKLYRGLPINNGMGLKFLAISRLCNKIYH